MPEFKITDERAAHLGEVDEVVELDLDEREETAMVAAGWLEPVKEKKGGKS